ncbi:hypothetical protein C1H76_8135 [Elsinoe australis]|uniref:Beta-glucuronidase C-terminal domain-containing protein n=1 Tax=Elsinoe australis TaxID=40998 RepID=A0A4U7AP64_9PEZI|nr:hypothetical protein C1H76_8135 [Elsinoe australis]
MAASLLIALSSLSLAAAQGTLNLRPIASLANGSTRYSDFIDPSFAGFGIEPSNLFSFTGYDKPNELSFNLIGNLNNYTGAPPHLRLGGNTQDYMVFSEDQQQYTWINNPNATGQGNFASDSMLIGPKFFEVVNRFPYGTPVTWGLNLAYSDPDYLDRITQMAEQVTKNVPNVKLVSFEIGNEPDLYLQNGFRTGEWGGRVYSQQWLTRAQAVFDRVLKPLNLSSNFFEPGTTANTIGTSFQIEDMTELGIETAANGTDNTTFISSWNQHDYYYFVGVTGRPLTLEEFMDLQSTNIQFAAWETQIQQSDATPYPYALREMCSVGPIGMEGITNTFGNALWTLNFFLYAATLNITSVQMHMTDNSNASAWQPLEMYDRQPFVRPLYYGYAAFDQIIGPSCTTQVAPLDLGPQPDGYNGKIKTYSIYQAGQLATVVIINARMANVTQTDKKSLSVTITLPSSLAGQDVHLAYLSNDGADATAGTVWNGISYEAQGSNGRATVVDDSDRTVRVGSDGTATVNVRDSEALAVNVGGRVGQGQPDKTACAAIAARSQAIGPTPVTSGVEESGSSSGSGGSATASQGTSRSGNNGAASASPTGMGGRVSVEVLSVLGAAVLGTVLLL